MRRCALILSAALAAGPQARAAADLSCPRWEVGESSGDSLPHVAAALKPNGRLNILAVGSAAMQPDATPPGAASASQSGFAWQMAHALEAGVHGLHVTLTIRGGRSLTAADMAAIIGTELARGKYQLVMWQTGTVDAVEDASPADFYQALTDGAAAITGASANLVLVNPQYSRFLEANANLEPYLSAMQAVGSLPGVKLFDRLEIMRAWADDGAIDLERAAKADRPALAARLHACLGSALARALLSHK